MIYIKNLRKYNIHSSNITTSTLIPRSKQGHPLSLLLFRINYLFQAVQKGLNKKQKSKELEMKKLKLLIQDINMHIKSKDSSHKVLEFVNLPRYQVQGQYKKQTKLFNLSLHCCCSVVKLCPTLCDSVDCFTPGNGACIPQ